MRRYQEGVYVHALIGINCGRVVRLSSLAGLSLGADVSSDFAAKGLRWARAVASQFRCVYSN